MNHIPKELIEHLEEDKKIQSKIFEELKTIRENHLYHIEKDVAVIKSEITWLKQNGETREDIIAQADVDWIKKFLWIVVTSVAGVIIVGLLNLLMKN